MLSPFVRLCNCWLCFVGLSRKGAGYEVGGGEGRCGVCSWDGGGVGAGGGGGG